MPVDKDILVRQSIRKHGNRYRYYIGDDLRQEAELAKFLGRDQVDAIKWAWKYWVFGNRHHGRLKFDKPQIECECGDCAAECETPEEIAADHEFIQKLLSMVSDKAQAAIEANLTGKHYVWRPEVKQELLAAARELLEMRI